VDVSCASVSGAPDDLLRLFNLLRSLALPTPKPGNVAKASITQMAFNAGLLTLNTDWRRQFQQRCQQQQQQAINDQI
jgi:hypothetical protein